MPDKAWKQYERRIARHFATVRTPLSGMTSRHTSSDTLHTKLFIDCKLRREFKTVVRYFKAIESLATNESKIPVLITKIPHMKDETSLVTIRLKNVHELSTL